MLPDGETWNTIGDCVIMVIDHKQFEELCGDHVKARELNPIASMSFNDS
jgi:hypothetical protein